MPSGGTCLENILYSGTSIIEGMKFKPTCEKDLAFMRIWQGGILRGAKLVLKLQLSEDGQGRLLYNGRLYNRDCWTWQPPKFIRLEGRRAKEQPNPFNDYPTKIIEIDEMKVRIREECECGGHLLYDHNLNLYCEKCFLIQE